MILVNGIALAVLLAVPTSVISPDSPRPAAPVPNTETAEKVGPAGIWTGSLLQRDWSFDFRQEGGVWSGKYRTPGGTAWYPLSDLVVAQNTLSFGMETKPKIHFSLEFDAKAPGLSGTAAIDGVATVPFSATRAP